MFAEKSSVDLVKPKILVIDDSPMFCKGINTILKPLTENIHLASDGESGLKLIDKNNYDLIVTDIVMPGINGLDLCKKLRRNKTAKQIPIIIVSQFDTQNDILKGFQTGANAYISKNEVSSSLLNSAKKLLEKNALYKMKTILVVENSIVINSIICNFLNNNGFKTIKALNGIEADNLLREFKVDLIISDIELPESNGLEFCRKVKESKDFYSIPFIAMSVNDNKNYIRSSMNLGADAFIIKPFVMEELLSIIDRILSEEFRRVQTEKEHLKKEQNLFIHGMESLISALEARDKYTRGHSEDVASITCGMAELSGVDSDSIEAYKLGGRLHDIGKIGIRDDILLKPGSLTTGEFRIIKEHPVIGAKILSSIPSLHRTLNVILYHHERMDGKGYPEGLKGDQIPREARMIAVADTYHSLTSNRPYRQSMSEDKALQILYESRGSQLFPDCVDLFMKWHDLKNNHCLLETG